MWAQLSSANPFACVQRPLASPITVRCSLYPVVVSSLDPVRWRCHAQDSQKDTIMDNERVIAALTSTGISGTTAGRGARHMRWSPISTVCCAAASPTDACPLLAELHIRYIRPQLLAKPQAALRMVLLMPAVIGASLAQVSLWREFRWDVSDFRLAFSVGAVLLAYEFVLLGLPWYSSLLQEQAARRASVATSSQDTSATPTGTRAPFNLYLEQELLTQDPGFTPAALRAALGLQLACFAASVSASKGRLPIPVDATLIVLRESAKELLQRGLLVTLIGGWLADRSFEAGADEILMLGGLQLYTTDACRYFAASVATLVLLPPVLADAQALSLSVATNWALLSTQTADEDDSLSKDLEEYRFFEALQRAANADVPTRLAYVLHAARGVLRFASLNAVFAVTQNLSASLLLSVTSNLLLLVYNNRTRDELVRQNVMRP